MIDWIIIFTFSTVCLGYLVTGFRRLPHEGNQVLVVIPVYKKVDGDWQGISLTYYGLLVANALTLAAAFYMGLMASIGVTLDASMLILTVVLMISVPAARWTAKLVEKKSNTFSTGGASFLGLVAALPAVYVADLGLDIMGQNEISPLAILAALSVAYCFGESLGRLACISFGCCFGKPVADYNPRLYRWLNRFSFSFEGSTKKIAYAQGWEGVRVFPIQAVTALVYLAAGTTSLVMFESRNFTAAVLFSVTVFQGWRFASEFLRADYRGQGKISAYQILSLIALVYVWGIAFILPSEHFNTVDFVAGFGSLWNTIVLISLQCLWLLIFFYFGKSKVLGSHVSIYVHKQMD